MVLQSGEVAPDVPEPVLTAAALDQRTSDLFGPTPRAESALPVPTEASPVETGPTWDIDVRSYETFDRVRFYVDRFSSLPCNIAYK